MKLAYPTRMVLRADGTAQALDGPRTMAQIEALIGPGCEGCDTVRLDGVHVMIVDDLGHQKGLPVNENATALYILRCGPGVHWQIRGDVVILPDDDFAPAVHNPFIE